MSTPRLFAVAFAVSLCLPAQDGGKSAAGTPADAASKAAQAAPPVGVVDLVRAIEQYPKWIKLKGELEATEDAIKAELTNMNKSISELKASLELGGDSDERKVKELQYQGMLQQREAWAKLQRERIDLKHARSLLTVYEDLEVAIAKVAKARGVGIVLRMHNMGPSLGNPAKLSDKTVIGRVEAFERREVLFAADNVDLTDDLIKLLLVPLDEPKDGKDAGGDAGKAAPPKAPETPKKNGG